MTMTKRMLLGTFGLLLLLLSGCAHAPALEPLRVRATELGTLDEQAVTSGRPLLVEVREGDVIPLDLAIDGDLVGTPAGTEIPLTAKRTFFLRIDKEGLAVSRDGTTFGTKSRVPGTFRFGVSATRARGLRGEITLTTPQP